MNTANLFLVESLQEILNHGMRTKLHPQHEVRTKYADGQTANYLSIGPKMVEYDIKSGDYPINTLRKFPLKSSVDEIRWIYQKQSNDLSVARAMGINWWDSWDIGDGTIGLRYGATVARYNLMQGLINTFIKDPLSRRKMMSLWQEQDFTDDPKGLKPCAHTTNWHLNITPEGVYEVTVTLYQRSMDLLVTSSINPYQYYILSEALMAYLRYITGKDYRLVKLRHDVGDIHIYDRHIAAAHEVLERFSMGCNVGEEVKVILPHFIPDWKEWTYKDFKLTMPKVDPLNSPLELAI